MLNETEVGLPKPMSNDGETVSVDISEATQPVHGSECISKKVIRYDIADYVNHEACLASDVFSLSEAITSLQSEQ